MKKMPMEIRSNYKAKFVAHVISQQFLNRGKAIEGKIVTVLNDLRTEVGIRTLKSLEQSSVEQLLECYQEKVEQGEISLKTVATYVSALNDIISYVNEYLNKDLSEVSAKEWGLSAGPQEYTDKSVNEEAHQAFMEWLQNKAEETGNVNYQALAHSVELQRELGLRARESFCLKVVEKDTTADKLQITREDMPKNAREREISIRTDAQREALESAQNFAKEHGWRSLIAPDMSLREWKSFAYSTVDEFRRETGYENYHFHGERHAYAHETYERLWEEKTGHSIECPVASGHSSKDSWFEYVCSETGLTREEVEQIDHEVRQAISEDLGHNREDITYTYLGK